jgi:hypothetical protein
LQPFIAGNKKEGGGDVQLTDGYDDIGDLDYRYEVRFCPQKSDLLITGFISDLQSATVWSPSSEQIYTEIFKGALSELKANPEIEEL